MSINNSNTPANYVAPTREQIAAQLQREQQASAMGKLKAKEKLQKQKEGMDYSRSQGGSVLLDRCLEFTGVVIQQAMEKTLQGAGLGSALIGPVFQDLTNKTLVNLPKLDRDGKPTGEDVRVKDKTVNLWDSDEIAFIVLLTMIDVCRMPMLGSIDKISGSGKRNGTRPNIYKLESLISDRINDHLAHRYIRECTKNTGQDRLIDFILADAYDNKAGWSQKKTNTRIKRRNVAQEFIDDDLTPFAKVLQWRPFSNRMGHALAGKLISYAEMGCELVLEFPVFKTVDRYNDQFYGLTEPAEAFVDKLDLARIGKTFVPDVIVCPPRLHSADQAGGYIGVAQSLIKRSFTGGFKGEFIPGPQHLRFINGQQSVPFKINQEILEVMNALEAQPHQEWREQANFVPAPRRDHYLKSPELGPKPATMNEQQKADRDALRKVRKKEWSVYKHKQDESEASLTVDTLELANRVAPLERFWLPVQGGFRGRAYCANHLLNSQGMSYQRSLLLFANEVPVDHLTQTHLEWAIAGFAGQDKKSWEQRSQWFIQHKAEIMDSIKDLDSITDPTSFWRTYTQMDDEWAFLACALEYKRLFLSSDRPLTTGIIIHIDATCSGGQLIAGLTGSGETAKATNCVPGPVPFDIYAAVKAKMQEMIKGDNYRIPLRDVKGDVKKGAYGEVLYMAEKRARYLFSTDPTKMQAVRKGIKGGFLPRLYGAGIGKTIAGMREKWKFIHLNGKQKKLSLDEARGLAPYFEAGLNDAVPALTAYVEWARNVADLALRVKLLNPMTKAGKPAKKDQFTPRLDADGDPVLELRAPMPNGSVMVQRYPVTKAKALRIDHLTTHSIFNPITDFRDQQLHEPTPEVSFKDVSKATAPNLIHAADAAVFAEMVDGYAGSYSLIHDSIGCSPGAQRNELIQRFQRSYEKVTTFDYLNGILDENNIDRQLNPPPAFGTFHPTDSRGSGYMVC